MIPPCTRCSKDDFKKTRDRKAHLKRKFKCKPKPIPQIKDQMVGQVPEAGPGPATQTYREEQTIIQSNINQKIHPRKHFRSIYEVEDRIIKKEPPTKNIEFLERRPDPNRQHQNLNSMTV